MLRCLVLLLASLLLAQRSLAADKAARQWLPVQGKVFVPGGCLGESCTRRSGAAGLRGLPYAAAAAHPPPPRCRRSRLLLLPQRAPC
jgi:hypothetical protein